MANRGMRGGGDSWKGLVTAVGESRIRHLFVVPLAQCGKVLPCARVALGLDYIDGMFLGEGSFESRKLDTDVVDIEGMSWKPIVCLFWDGGLLPFYFLSE